MVFDELGEVRPPNPAEVAVADRNIAWARDTVLELARRVPPAGGDPVERFIRVGFECAAAAGSGNPVETCMGLLTAALIALADQARESTPRRSALAAKLRAARLAAGLTQQQVADEVGVTQSTVSYVEWGRVTPGRMTLARWARLLGIPPEELPGQDL